MSCLFSRDSRELLTLAVALACALTKDQEPEDIDRLAAFFTLLGDTLALFALHPGLGQSCLDEPEKPL